jgi:hypothetical protein
MRRQIIRHVVRRADTQEAGPRIDRGLEIDVDRMGNESGKISGCGVNALRGVGMAGGTGAVELREG